MPKDDIFRVMYIILKELYEHRKEGTRTPREDISSERLQITDGYWLSIICELLENGYITGISIRETKTGKAVSCLDDIDITLRGIEYLQENGMMKKVCNTLKEFKAITPGI